MQRHLTAATLMAAVALATASEAHHRGRPEVPGPLVGVSVEVDHRPASLYPAPDGSGRYYLEAHEGSSYVLHLANRTGERLGVVVSVDGLNAISGARDDGRGRMYVLGPWQRTTVRGWRTSLEDVRRFTFVDEKASYAARSGKANSRMGWIELDVFREKRRWTRRDLPEDRVSGPDEAGRSADRAESPPPSAKSSGAAEAETAAPRGQARARSYPGTGWGSRAHDPAVLVTFEPERSPAQETTLRYEYQAALVALGVLPAPPRHPDRLAERDRGGFAPPPLW